MNLLNCTNTLPRYTGPEVIVFSNDVTVVVEEFLVLQCTVMGVPTPTTKWIRNGQTLVNGARYGITVQHPNTSTVQTSLTVSAIQLSDAGGYTCMAENSVSTATAEATVTVHG